MENKGVVIGGLPLDMLTSERYGTRRLRVDTGQTSFFEGREFRVSRQLNAPIVYRFTCAVDFILFTQFFTIDSGEYEFRAYRSGNITPSGTWTEMPYIFGKNISSSRPLFDGSFYETQTLIESGGAITIADAEEYSDIVHLKTSTATGQISSINGPNGSERYLAAGTYYLSFTGTATGTATFEWEERP